MSVNILSANVLYNQIFELNDISKYFPVFEKYQYDEINTVVSYIENIVATCVMSNVTDSDYTIITPLISLSLLLRGRY